MSPHDTLPVARAYHDAWTTKDFASAAALLADNLVVAAQLDSGGLASIGWTVRNGGTAAANGSWTDRIVLSSDTVIGNGDDVVLASVVHSGGLAVAASYAQITTVRVPAGLNGNYRIAVVADVAAAVLEPDTRADNTTVSAPVQIHPNARRCTSAYGIAPSRRYPESPERISWHSIRANR